MATHASSTSHSPPLIDRRHGSLSHPGGGNLVVAVQHEVTATPLFPKKPDPACRVKRSTVSSPALLGVGAEEGVLRASVSWWLTAEPPAAVGEIGSQIWFSAEDGCG